MTEIEVSDDSLNRFQHDSLNPFQHAYPKIVQETEVNDLINKSKNTDRLKHMLREQTLLEEKLKKYNKIKDRWNKADVTIKITGTILIFISTSLAIVSGVIGSLGVLTPVISAILAAIFSALSLFKMFIIQLIEHYIFNI